MTTSKTSETAAKKDVQKLQRAIVDGLEDVKAQDIRVFNTEHLSPLFERVIVASGTSNRQTKALAASVRDAVKEAGFPKPRTEGEENGEWIIVDCGAAVAHIMQPTIRQYYRLEDLWGEMPVRLKLGAAKPVAPEAAAPAKKAAPRKGASAPTAAPAAKAPARKAPSRSAAPARAAAKAPAKAAPKFVPKAAPQVALKATPKAAPKAAAKTAGKAPAAKTTSIQKLVVKPRSAGAPAKKAVPAKSAAPAKKAAPAKRASPAAKAAPARAPAARKSPAAKAPARKSPGRKA